MKKFAIALITAALFFSASAFTVKSDEIPGRVKTAFANDFTTALNISWVKNENLFFVNFNWNASDVKAVFNADGDLLNMSRKINIAQLPLKVTLAIEKEYKDYKLQEKAVEIIAENETTYQLTVSNDKKQISLTSNANGEITENK